MGHMDITYILLEGITYALLEKHMNKKKSEEIFKIVMSENFIKHQETQKRLECVSEKKYMQPKTKEKY